MRVSWSVAWRLLAAGSLCTVPVDTRGHLHLICHWVVGLSLLDLVGVGTRALQHGLQHLLIPHKEVQLT